MDDLYTRAFPLHAAAYIGDADLCVQLIDSASINDRDQPILYDVDCRDSGQFTALHHASENAHVNVCRVLLDRGADVNARDRNERTPLIWLATALSIRTAAVCKTLIDGGAEVNAQAQNGSTALHMAAYQGHENMCKLLVQSGALLDALNSVGEMPAISARNAGYNMLSDCLQNSRGVKYLESTGPSGELKLVWDPPQDEVRLRLEEMQLEWVRHVCAWRQRALVGLVLKRATPQLQVDPLLHILRFLFEGSDANLLSCLSDARISNQVHPQQHAVNEVTEVDNAVTEVANAVTEVVNAVTEVAGTPTANVVNGRLSLLSHKLALSLTGHQYCAGVGWTDDTSTTGDGNTIQAAHSRFPAVGDDGRIAHARTARTAQQIPAVSPGVGTVTVLRNASMRGGCAWLCGLSSFLQLAAADSSKDSSKDGSKDK
jgi:hypothetical protein